MKKYPKSVYMRRRITVLVAAIFAVMGLKGAVSAIMAPSYVCDPFVHIVDSGDSLWSIGESYCKGDMLALRYDLVRANDGTHLIHPGQIIQNPKGG